MRLQYLSIALIFVLSYIQTLAAPSPEDGSNIELVNPADLNSELTDIYNDAYRKTWDLYVNEYQRLYDEFLNYFSTHYPRVKRKRSYVSINEGMLLPKSLLSTSSFLLIPLSILRSSSRADSEIIKLTQDTTSDSPAVATD